MLSTSTRVAFIQSSWHSTIVDQARIAFTTELSKRGVSSDQIDFFTVPGAFEIPLHAQRLAQSGRYSAIVGCGFVVDGGIYRHEFVSEAVVSALMQVQLRTNVPVFSVVLTPHHFNEQSEHTAFFESHFAIKGAEAAGACVSTLDSLSALEGMSALESLSQI